MPRPARLVGPLLDWFAVNARDLPWRRTRDPYAIWVSEVMLQQTQVNTVIPYWERWLRELPDVAALAAAPEARVLKLWEGLGYYTRARNLQRAAREILARHGGRFPSRFAEVLALPGVGRYTAGAVCSMAFNQPAPVVDGNVIRVLARVFALRGNPRDRQLNEHFWNLAAQFVTAAARTHREESCSHLNQALMELGALICTPRQPECRACPWRRSCAARRHGLADQLPETGPRAPSTARHFLVFLVPRRGRWLVRQRPAGGVNAGLWEFPTIETERDADPAGTANQWLLSASARTGTRERGGGNLVRGQANGPRLPSIGRRDPASLPSEVAASPPLRLHPLGVVKCGITRYRLTLAIFRLELPVGFRLSPGAGRWHAAAHLTDLAFSSGQRKVLQLALRSSSVPSGRAAGSFQQSTLID